MGWILGKLTRGRESIGLCPVAFRKRLAKLRSGKPPRTAIRVIGEGGRIVVGVPLTLADDAVVPRVREKLGCQFSASDRWHRCQSSGLGLQLLCGPADRHARQTAGV